MPFPASSTLAQETRRHPPIVGSNGDSRHGSDRRPPSRSGRQADEMDRTPQSRVPDTRHHAAASDDGGDHWAVIASMIETCKLNGIDPQAWLTATLAKLAAGHSNRRRDQLMPWNCVPAVG